MNRYVLAGVIVVALTLSSLSGCHQKIPPGKSTVPELNDIHERLSYIIRQHGFHHGIMSNREDNRDIDSIFVSLPLDAVKRQHPGLEKMLVMVGTICALPEYSDISVYIELGTMDEADLNFMRNTLEKALTGKSNAKIAITPGARSDITITVTHVPYKRFR